MKPTRHETYVPCNLHSSKPTRHETYTPWNLRAMKPTCHVTYTPVNLHFMKPTRHETYMPWNLHARKPTRQETYTLWRTWCMSSVSGCGWSVNSMGMNSKNWADGTSRYWLGSRGQMLTPSKPSVAAYRGEYKGMPFKYVSLSFSPARIKTNSAFTIIRKKSGT